jgi:hypothetical protein
MILKRFGINLNSISTYVICVPVFFFLILSNIDGQTLKKASIEYSDKFGIEVEQTCLKCGMFNYESIIDRLDANVLKDIGDVFNSRSDIQFSI